MAILLPSRLLLQFLRDYPFTMPSSSLRWSSLLHSLQRCILLVTAHRVLGDNTVHPWFPFEVLRGHYQLGQVYKCVSAHDRVGWYTMVTGQSVVLWSPLHLLVIGAGDVRTIRWTKYMII